MIGMAMSRRAISRSKIADLEEGKSLMLWSKNNGVKKAGKMPALGALLIAFAFLICQPAFAQEKPVANRVEVNGMQMYYEVSGQGDPLIVLHGAYMNIPSMGEIIPLLAKTHRVYALEFQGHGRTTDINRPITYQNLADDVAAFMDKIHLRKADVFGYSMGASAGLQLAIRHPEKVDQLVAASTAYDHKGWQKAYRDFIPQLTVEMMMAMPFAAEYKTYAANPDGFRGLVEKLIALETVPMAWEADIRKMKTPVFIITGDADTATLEHNVAMFRLLGGGEMGDMGSPLSPSRLAVLPATSHTAVIGQAPLLHALVEPYLKGEKPKSMFE
jgi:pimeloyl-ACP methyl ester carboxylesterase